MRTSSCTNDVVHIAFETVNFTADFDELISCQIVIHENLVFRYFPGNNNSGFRNRYIEVVPSTGHGYMRQW